MNSKRRLAMGLAVVLGTVTAGGSVDPAAPQTRPEGEMRWALYVTVPPGEVKMVNLEAKMGTCAARLAWATRSTVGMMPRSRSTGNPRRA